MVQSGNGIFAPIKEHALIPLTMKDLIYKGYGCEDTLLRYVKQGMPRHGERRNYWYLEDEVRDWILWRGKKHSVQCPYCGKMIEIGNNIFQNNQNEKRTTPSTKKEE